MFCNSETYRLGGIIITEFLLGFDVPKINEELIELYQQCTDSESITKAQEQWLEK